MSVKERTVARGRGCVPTRDLAEAAADFYLLESLAASGDEEARSQLTRHEERLAEEFSAYLDVAVGGELRYAKRHLPEEEIPEELACYFREIKPADRGKAWLVWTVVRRVLGPRALELAEGIFSRRGWPENFGGWAWAQIARILRQHLEGTLPPRIFVDTCFSLQHCTGSVFTKLWDVSRLNRVLVSQGADDLDGLLRFASARVRKRWRRTEWEKRMEHDPIWLGVQVLETYDEMAEEVVGRVG